MRFRLPGSKRDIEAESRVAWSDRRVGMGLQFEKVEPADQAAIDEFVDQHFFTQPEGVDVEAVVPATPSTAAARSRSR